MINDNDVDDVDDAVDDETDNDYDDEDDDEDDKTLERPIYTYFKYTITDILIIYL